MTMCSEGFDGVRLGKIVRDVTLNGLNTFVPLSGALMVAFGIAPEEQFFECVVTESEPIR